MKITKITASFSKKYQLRQFEPIEVFAGAEAEISSEEASDSTLLDRCYSNLIKLTKYQVELKIEEIKSQGTKVPELDKTSATVQTREPYNG